MKMTLLEMTQKILSKMDDDDVNSIGDTTASLQVANEIENTYYEMIGNIELPENNQLIQFEGLISPTVRPNYLRTKDIVDKFEFLLYNIGTSSEPLYREIKYKNPKDFLLYVVNQSQGSSTMVVTDFSGAHYPVITDQPPTYYTMFDDEYLAFNAFNQSVDDTLQESKSLALGQIIPTFELRDDFTPDLPAKYFPQLLAEAASMCFINHKQVPNSKEEQRARRQRVRQQNNRKRNSATHQGPGYGR